MRRVWLLIISAILLLVPGEVLAQSGKPAETAKAPDASQANKDTQKNVYYQCLSKEKMGQRLNVKLLNGQRVVGELSAVQVDHFELRHGGKVQRIAYTNVAAIEHGKTFWQRVRRVTSFPAEAVAVGGAVVLFSFMSVAEWISGQSLLYE